MSNQLYANSQLMYYPTHELETYRMLGLIGRISIKTNNQWEKKYKLDDMKSDPLTGINDEIYKEISIETLDGNVDVDYTLYEYFIKTKNYNAINKYFDYFIGSDDHKKNTSSSNNYQETPNIISIADLQAGEGKWLSTFTEFIPKNKIQQAEIKTIANELEEERFNKITTNIPNIAHSYCGSFEELQLPKECISLLLFNPPYGETNGERNVRRYLRMTLERTLLAKSGHVLMVIREDDALDITDLIGKHFSTQLVYKTHKEENEKYKQVVILLRAWGVPLDETAKYQALEIQAQSSKYIDLVKNAKEFKIGFYNSCVKGLPVVDLPLLMENFEHIQSNTPILSNKKSSTWNWIKEMTELKDLGNEKLILPKPLKSGEIANLLASGYINSTMQLEDGTGNHIAVGGVKMMEDKVTDSYKDDNGEKVTETKIIKYSKPFLNLLIKENGKMKIKELEAE